MLFHGAHISAPDPAHDTEGTDLLHTDTAISQQGHGQIFQAISYKKRSLDASTRLDSRATAPVVAERNVWKIPAVAMVATLLIGVGTGSHAGTGNIV
ncbi:hypothetical protein, partial [Streptomyces sp. SP17KL33]|uniref:hypothetical protein n=1 Tax=Streptomyces sp. SP17KL33 TaxID=3002534 RepID=UPI002E7D2EB6|nr:hypothetical protein [Streptomyces sp. SP17KL33]